MFTTETTVVKLNSLSKIYRWRLFFVFTQIGKVEIFLAPNCLRKLDVPVQLLELILIMKHSKLEKLFTKKISLTT